MPRPTHSSRFDHPNNIEWVQIVKLLIMQFSPLPCYRVPLRPKCSPQQSILKHLQLTFLLQCQRPRFTPIQNNTQNYIFLYILIVRFLHRKLEDKIFSTRWYQAFLNFSLLLISSWIEFWFVKVVPKWNIEYIFFKFQYPVRSGVYLCCDFGLVIPKTRCLTEIILQNIAFFSAAYLHNDVSFP